MINLYYIQVQYLIIVKPDYFLFILTDSYEVLRSVNIILTGICLAPHIVNMHNNAKAQFCLIVCYV